MGKFRLGVLLVIEEYLDLEDGEDVVFDGVFDIIGWF